MSRSKGVSQIPRYLGSDLELPEVPEAHDLMTCQCTPALKLLRVLINPHLGTISVHNTLLLGT